MTWEQLDWEVLDRLREGFLAGQPARRAYWRSPRDLAQYDATFGERIGWKWDALLQSLQARGWRPPLGWLTDWGCGSGVAGRRVLEAFGAEAFTGLRVHDHSLFALQFATERARASFPALAIENGPVAPDPGSAPAGTLVISHVINELPASERRRLFQAVRAAVAVLWVEPGTHADSHALIDAREGLRDEFGFAGPCPHAERCGLHAVRPTPHWCHFFAPPPPGIFAQADWVRFAQRAGIDLRRAPYSCLVLDRRLGAGQALAPPGSACLLGALRTYKGFARVFSCEASGVHERTAQNRDVPEWIRTWDSGDTAGYFRWALQGERIAHVERV